MQLYKKGVQGRCFVRLKGNPNAYSSAMAERLGDMRFWSMAKPNDAAATHLQTKNHHRTTEHPSPR